MLLLKQTGGGVLLPGRKGIGLFHKRKGLHFIAFRSQVAGKNLQTPGKAAPHTRLISCARIFSCKPCLLLHSPNGWSLSVSKRGCIAKPALTNTFLKQKSAIMELTGRLTYDAKVRATKNDREVVNFTIAINDYFKTKDGEQKNIATYVDCSYWLSTKVAENLKKGSIVQVFGRIGVNAYTTMDGQPRANLTFHVNSLKRISSGKANASEQTANNTSIPIPQTMDDLPF
jgi:single-strand DNA-binding protein